MANRTANNDKVRNIGILQNVEVGDDDYAGTIFERELLMFGDDGLLDQAGPGESDARFAGVMETGQGTTGGAVQGSTPAQKLKYELWGYYRATVQSTDALADAAEGFKLEDGGASPTLAFATHVGRRVYCTDSRTLDIDPDDPTAPLAGYIFRVITIGGNAAGEAVVYLSQDFASAVSAAGGANPLAQFVRPIGPMLVDGAIDLGSRQVFQERFINKPLLNADSPGSVAALTASTLTAAAGTATLVIPAFVATTNGDIHIKSFTTQHNALLVDVAAIRSALINGSLGNKIWEIAGTNATTALATFAVDGGITLTTATANADQEILRGHQDTDQSAIETIQWSTASKIRIRCVLVPGATITTVRIMMGFKILETTFDIATDADQTFLKFDTAGAVSTTNWTSVDSATGTDNEQDTGIAVTGSQEYEMVIDVDEDRVPRYYIDGDLVATGTALTSVTTIKPFVGVQSLTGARAVTVRHLSVAVGH